MTSPPDRRYVLRAYVSMTGQVLWKPNEGSSRFVDIYIMRPDNYRFAVTGNEPPFMLYDLWGCQIGRLGWVEPGEARAFDTLDAAVMAGALTK